jgi:hypothetical protein
MQLAPSHGPPPFGVVRAEDPHIADSDMTSVPNTWCSGVGPNLGGCCASEEAEERGVLRNLQIRLPMGDDAPPLSPRALTFGPGGRLQPEINTRFSAVAVLTSFNPRLAEVERIAERRFATGMSIGERIATVLRVISDQTDAGRYCEEDREHRLTILHNPFAKIRLSPEFAGAYDDQWMHNGDHCYQEASWGIRGNDVPGRVPLELPSQS